MNNPEERVVKSAGHQEGAGSRASEAKKIDFGELEDAAGYFVVRASSVLMRAISRDLSLVDLQPGQLSTMVLIHHNPGITPRVLTQVTRRDKSTITPIVSELEHKGLIMRMRSNADRRSFGLSTTAKGAEVVDELDRIIRYHEKRIEELIGAEGRQELLKQVKLLAARL